MPEGVHACGCGNIFVLAGAAAHIFGRRNDRSTDDVLSHTPASPFLEVHCFQLGPGDDNDCDGGGDAAMSKYMTTSPSRGRCLRRPFAFAAASRSVRTRSGTNLKLKI